MPRRTPRAAALTLWCALWTAAALGGATPGGAQTLEPGWATIPIGTTSVSGAATFGPNAITVASSGGGAAGTSDQATFVYRRISGGATVIARLDAMGPLPGSQSGVMIRESLHHAGRMALLFGNTEQAPAYSARTAAGGPATGTSSQPGSPTAAGTWLRLDRTGDVLTAATSTDGAAWTLAGSAVLPALANTIYVGLAVASGSLTASTSSQFGDVVVIGSGTLDAGLSAREIGPPLLTGGSWSEGGTAILDGAGTGIAGTTDQFRYIYRAMTGDMDIVARLAPFAAVPTARAGLMMRRGLGTGAIHLSLLASADGTVETTGRVGTSGPTITTGSAAAANPLWLRLRRRGSIVTALQSPDGSTWQELGSQTMTDATYNVGLAVSSGDAGRLARATFDGVAIFTNQPPTVALTEPAADVTTVAPATLTVSASAQDAEGAIAKVDFFAGTTLLGTDATSPYSLTWTNAAPGSYAVTAVATDNHGAATTSTPRVVVVIPNAPPTVALTAPADGGSGIAPAALTLQATAADGDGAVVRVDFYAGASLVGRDTTSPYSIDWTGVPAGSYTLTAVAIDDRGAATTSASRTVVIVQNSPPTVALTAPVSGSTSVAPSTVTLQATATDGDGTIVRVEFYAGPTLVGTDTTSPYSAEWTGAGAGTHVLRAVATDDRGATTASETCTITITANAAPAVTLTAPTSGLVLGAPTSVTLRATASDTDGTIVKVEFYAGTTLIRTDTTSPYRATWNVSALGTYVLTAVATDDRGVTAVSAPRLVTIVPNTGPTVTITAPLASARIIVPATVTIEASASDIDGTVARVDFYVGSTLLGTDKKSPYALDWVPASLGTHVVTAVAVDNSGAATASLPRSVIVAGTDPPSVSLTSPSDGTALTQPASVTVSAAAAAGSASLASVAFYDNGTLLGVDTSSPYTFTWTNPPAGMHRLTAVARDTSDSTAVSHAVILAIAGAGTPTTAIFTPASIHDVVDRYVLEIYPYGANPALTAPTATIDLGYPAVVDGECRVDIRTAIAALPPGYYVGMVTAQSSQEGNFSSAPSPVFGR